MVSVLFKTSSNILDEMDKVVALADKSHLMNVGDKLIILMLFQIAKILAMILIALLPEYDDIIESIKQTQKLH